MRYTTQINNSCCIEWGLNASQGALVDLLNQASSWATQIEVNGAMYFWVARGAIVKELPLYYSKNDTVYRHFKALVDKKIIEYVQQGRKDLIKLTDKGEKWNELINKNSEINPRKLGNKSEKTRKQIRENSEINPTDKGIKDKLTKDNKEKSIKKETQTDLQLLQSLGVDEQSAIDWLSTRKAKRAPAINKSVLNNIQNQAIKANITFAEAIKHCAENGWQGFNADWLANKQQPQRNTNQAKRWEDKTTFERIASVDFKEQEDIKRASSRYRAGAYLNENYLALIWKYYNTTDKQEILQIDAGLLPIGSGITTTQKAEIIDFDDLKKNRELSYGS